MRYFFLSVYFVYLHICYVVDKEVISIIGRMYLQDGSAVIMYSYILVLGV